MKKTAPALALLILCASLPVVHAEESGGTLYKMNCAPCHGVSGDANTPAGKKFNATVFNTAEGLQKSDEELLMVTRTGKGQMPSWSDVLTDTELKSVIAYIRTFQKKQ